MKERRQTYMIISNDREKVFATSKFSKELEIKRNTKPPATTILNNEI